MKNLEHKLIYWIDEWMHTDLQILFPSAYARYFLPQVFYLHSSVKDEMDEICWKD